MKTTPLTYAELSARADELLAAYEAADQALLDAINRGAPREERRRLRAAVEAANEAHIAACEAHDAAEGT